METLEIIIGIVFIFLLLSILGTILQEFVTTAWSFRGRVLLDGLAQLLEIEDKDAVKAVKKKIKASKSYRKFKSKYFFNLVDLLPSYLSAEQVSIILQEIMQEATYEDGQKGCRSYQMSSKGAYAPKVDVKEAVPLHVLHIDHLKTNISDFELAEKLEILCKGEAAEGVDKLHLEDAKQMLAANFEQMMDRSTGWFKRRIQLSLLVVGLLIAIAFNADTLQIYSNLTSNPESRKAALALAEDFVNNSKVEVFTLPADSISGASPQPDTALIRELRDMHQLATKLINEEIREVHAPLGLGWNDFPEESAAGKKVYWVASRIPGWLITALAISLGAPFWFDLLGRLVNLRSAGKRPESPKPASTPQRPAPAGGGSGEVEKGNT